MCHICDSPCRERSKVGLGTDRDEVWAILDYSNLKTLKTRDLIASWDYTPRTPDAILLPKSLVSHFLNVHDLILAVSVAGEL
jgi:hypothetical protein